MQDHSGRLTYLRRPRKKAKTRNENRDSKFVVPAFPWPVHRPVIASPYANIPVLPKFNLLLRETHRAWPSTRIVVTGFRRLSFRSRMHLVVRVDFACLDANTQIRVGACNFATPRLAPYWL